MSKTIDELKYEIETYEKMEKSMREWIRLAKNEQKFYEEELRALLKNKEKDELKLKMLLMEETK